MRICKEEKARQKNQPHAGMSSMCMWQGRRRSALYGIYWWELQLPVDMILFNQDRISALILCVYLSLLSITDQGVGTSQWTNPIPFYFFLYFFSLEGSWIVILFFIASLIHFIESLLKEQTPLVLDLRCSTSKHHGFFVEAGRQDVSSIYFPCSTCPPPLNVCKQEAAVKMLSGYGNRIFMDSKTYL